MDELDELIEKLTRAYRLVVQVADSYAESENRSYYHHLRGKSTGLYAALRIAEKLKKGLEDD